MGADIAPGVLFQAMHWCVCGVASNARLATGFLDSNIPGASVICGMVNMGVALITLVLTHVAVGPPPFVPLEKVGETILQ
jgi:hypothetical protein